MGTFFHLTVRRWTVLFPLFFLLWYSPYVDFPIRVLTVTVASLIIVGSIILAWRRRFLRWIVLVIFGLFALFIVMPSQSRDNSTEIRGRYCEALDSYQGCRYQWGGVGYFGIDCSGFVQKSLEDALVAQGIRTHNPALLRESAWIYWYRTTAKVLGEGDAGRTYTVTTCPNLNALDYSLLMPGDLAVTTTGEHVMAYLGDKVWIAADPTEGKVTRFNIPELKNPYFSVPMRIVRWKILSSSEDHL
jgi:hypothetical protein